MIATPTAELSGIMVALITPFTDDGNSIDAERLQQHIQRMIDAGIHGLVPGGSTGEFTALTMAERKQLVELCVKYADGKIPVVAGIGTLHTKDTLELAAHAYEAGATALMVVPPFYDPLNLEQLKEYCSEIFEASHQLPILYYNIPSASGLTLTPTEMASLSDSGVKYLKDTSGNAPALTEMLFDPAFTSKVTAFNGWDTLTFYGLAAGSKGSVWGATNVIPDLSAQLWDAVAVKGDLKKGRELWSKIWPICNFLEQGNYASAVKTGMEIQGFKTGGMRKPFKVLQGERRQELARLLKEAGVKVVE